MKILKCLKVNSANMKTCMLTIQITHSMAPSISIQIMWEEHEDKIEFLPVILCQMW